MSGVFSPDSRLMQVLHRFSALVVLNFLFLCNCIPVFTIGAALTAMYDVVFRMDTGQETTGAAACFRSFRKYFKDLTPIWILFLLLLSIGCGNAVIFSGWDNLLGRILSIFSLVILCNTIVILGYTLLPAEPFQNAKRDTRKKRAAPEHRQPPQNPVNLREQLFFLCASDDESLCIYTVEFSMAGTVFCCGCFFAIPGFWQRRLLR